MGVHVEFTDQPSGGDPSGGNARVIEHTTSQIHGPDDPIEIPGRPSIIEGRYFPQYNGQGLTMGASNDYVIEDAENGVIRLNFNIPAGTNIQHVLLA